MALLPVPREIPELQWYFPMDETRRQTVGERGVYIRCYSHESCNETLFSIAEESNGRRGVALELAQHRAAMPAQPRGHCPRGWPRGLLSRRGQRISLFGMTIPSWRNIRRCPRPLLFHTALLHTLRVRTEHGRALAGPTNRSEASAAGGRDGSAAGSSGLHCPAGGCQSSTLLPSGSMTHPNLPYSESSVLSSTLQPSSRSAARSAGRSSTR